MIAMAGKPPPRFEPKRARTGWRRGPGGPNFVLQLPDGRWLVARQVRERPNPIFWIAAALGAVAIAVAIGAFPWCAASADGWNGSRPASTGWAAATSARA